MIDNNKQYTNQNHSETIITAQTKNARSSLQISIRAWSIIHSAKRSQSTLDNTLQFQCFYLVKSFIKNLLVTKSSDCIVVWY